MYQPLFIIFGIASLIASILSLSLYITHRNTEYSVKIGITNVSLFWCGFFIAAVLLFFPIHFVNGGNVNGFYVFETIFSSIRSAESLQFVRESFTTVLDSVNGLDEGVKFLFSFYSLILFIVAPIQTAYTIIIIIKYLFSDFWSMLAYYFKKHKCDLYVISEINDESIILAKSIIEMNKKSKEEKGEEEKRKEKALIIFAKVPKDSRKKLKEEDDLFKEKNVLCFHEAVQDLKLEKLKSKQKLEIFIMGYDESEVIAQSRSLRDKFEGKEQPNEPVQIYVYSTSPETGIIIDSFNNDNKQVVNNKDNKDDKGVETTDIQKENLESMQDNRFDRSCKIRRINPDKLICMEMLSHEKILEIIENSNEEKTTSNEEKPTSDEEKIVNNKKTINILMVGMGKFGKLLLQTAVWLYQLDGYMVNITVIDQANNVKKILKQECPELLDPPDDATAYKINIFEGVDCFTSDFDDIIECEKNNILSAQMAFVFLGDDDLNLRVSILLRKLFQRNNKETLVINSMFYEYGKVATLSNLGKNGQNDNINNNLRTHEGKTYDINYFGKIGDQYEYKRIDELKKYEDDAEDCHTKWIDVRYYFKKYYKMNGEFQERVDAKMKAEEVEKTFAAIEGFYEEENGSSKRNEKNYEKEKDKYHRYEYFRDSSIARAFHRDKIIKHFMPDLYDDYEKEMERILKDNEDDELLIIFDNNEQYKTIEKSEHMRWVAYMRAQGFKYGEERDHLAKTHPFLVPWDDLPYLEKFKD